MGRVLFAATVLVLVASGSAGSEAGQDLTRNVTAIRAPLPRNAGSHYDFVLADIACASRTECVATGNLYRRSGAHGVLLVEKAGRWTVSEPPVPKKMAHRSPRFDALGAVSCPAVRRCVAVGDAHAGAQEKPLIFTQRGTGWHETVLPMPARTKRVGLTLVSCPSRGNCAAAGVFTTRSSDGEGLLVTERAGRWGRPFAAALPANAAKFPAARFDGEEAAEIDSLSCASARACTAVGTYTDTHGSPEGLLLTESRGKWIRGVEAALPANAAQPSGSYEYPVIGLGSVSCSSTADCAAVGGYGDDRSNQFGMTLSEHAGRWAPAEETPLPANGGLYPQQGNNASSPMGTIACPSPGACSAVGYYLEKNGDNGVLLLNEQASSWTPSALVFPSGVDERLGGFLDSLVCSSAGNCVAGGAYNTGISRYRPLLATEQDGRWLQGTAAPLPPGAGQSYSGSINSVSCPSAKTCVAVGGYGRDAAYPTQGGLIVTIRRG